MDNPPRPAIVPTSMDDASARDQRTRDLARADQQHVWHPFTPMAWWTSPENEPLVIERGEGAWLIDTRGNRYLDGNSSIWTNIHGHGHPRIVEAVANQAARLAHASFLGSTNPPAIELAARLTALFPPDTLTRVFYSDNGSTAIECSLKMAVQCRQLRAEPARTRFAAFGNAYHGDTLGASSLGGVDAFFKRFAEIGFDPVRVSSLDDLQMLPAATIATLGAVVIEPLIQGVNHMRLWPTGMLAALREWCDHNDVFLILDEVMTGFGRTGKMFACQHEEVVPDILCLAKGLTGGTLPLAATLVTEGIYSTFLDTGDATDRTFYYGHSYCGNPLGCAAALANLEIFDSGNVIESLPEKSAALGEMLASLSAAHPDHLGPPRQLGLIGAIDLMADAHKGIPFDPDAFAGRRACLGARRFGLLTRPIRDTLVFMPPLCVTPEEIHHMGRAMDLALRAMPLTRKQPTP